MLVLVYTLVMGIPLTDFWTLAGVGELLVIDNGIFCLYMFGGKKC